MKMDRIEKLYSNAVSVLGFKKVLITVLSGFAGWCICSTVALAVVPDNPQNIEQFTNEIIVEKENE